MCCIRYFLYDPVRFLSVSKYRCCGSTIAKYHFLIESNVRKVVRGKLHGIRVTGADLDYHGSITLDPDHCEAAGILPMEFVDIWNKNSGARLSTYVIYGERGSRCCILNGAAARTCQRGDEVI